MLGLFIDSRVSRQDDNSIFRTLITFDNTIAHRYCLDMIKSFACKETEKVWNREFSKKLPGDIQGTGKKNPIARRKLSMLDAASTLEDLKIPPNNRLEKLKRERAGQHSIRISQQWRICFRFENGTAFDVEIVDYH